MFGLVRFPDQTYGIYSMKCIIKKDGDEACIVKHKGAKYEAILISEKEQKEELRILQDEMLEQRISVEKSVGENYFADSKIGKEYVNLRRLSNSFINHDSVSSFVSGDRQSSDGALQENRKEVRIIRDILINPRKSPETSVDNEIFNDFSIGAEYLEINRSSTSFVNTFDDDIFSTVCGEKEDTHAQFQDNNSTTEDSDKISDKYKHNIIQQHGTLAREELSENDRELTVYGDDSDDDPDYDFIETDTDNSQDGNRNSPSCSILSAMDLNVEKVNELNESTNSPSKVIQIHLSASLTEPGCDDKNMKIAESRGRKGDKKPNFCYYCHTKQQKISRHLENRHSGEDEVKKFMMLPKGNIERAKIIGEIRKRGNFLFNTNENFNDGELIVSRRPKNSTHKSGKDFSACANCKGFFSKNTLRVHFKSCANIDSNNKRLANLLSKKITGRLHPKASSTVKNHLFPPLRDDDVSRIIRYDELVIIYANKMVEKYREARHFQMIRQRLRCIGNFLINIRKLNNEINDLTSIYDPKFVDMVLTAINMCARYTETTNSYEAPSVAFSLGTLLKQIGEILIIECIKNHNDVMKKNAKDFLKVFTQEVNINVNKTVAETQLKMSRSKTIMLPTMGDIKKLCDFLAKKRKDALETLKISFSSLAWMDLAEATLTSIQVFNRRRAGEVERISISEFEKYETVENSNNDLFQSLSEESKKLAKKYVRFTIRGKLNRTVPVLLDTHLCECIQMILNNRKNMGVHKNNPYIFGTPGSDTKKHPHLSACNLIRKFSEACGADHPTRLRGTNLRKHIATTCITLNLENQDVVDLSNFMGHSEKIHKGIYRQPIISRDILGISKLLETAQGNDCASSDDSEYEGLNEGDEVMPSNELSSTEVTPNNTLNEKKSRKANTMSGITRKVRWNQDEKDAIFRIFGDYMKRKVLPPLKVIQKVIKETPVLQNRTSPQIKTWIHNQFRSSKKKLSFSETVLNP